MEQNWGKLISRKIKYINKNSHIKPFKRKEKKNEMKERKRNECSYHSLKKIDLRGDGIRANGSASELRGNKVPVSRTVPENGPTK